MILGVLAAWALEVRVVLPDGPLVPGRPGLVEVVVADAGVPRPDATVELVTRGASVGRADAVGPGRYRLAWEPGGPDPVPVTVRVDGVEAATAEIAVVAAPAGAVGPPSPVTGVVGADRIEVHFPVSGPVDPRWLVARTSEGRVLDVTVQAGEVVVAVQPGADRTARVMAVGLADGARPGLPPRFAAIPLQARQTAAVNVGAGSSVVARVGRRSYGPFVAGADGTAQIVFDVFPGETGVDMLATDDLGNTRKVTTPLPTSSVPTLVGVEVPVGVDRLPEVYLAAWTPAGAPWSGETPSCRSGVGGREATWPVADGVYRYRTEPGAAVFDLRVECALDAAATTFRLPLPEPRPSAIDLRVYPEAVSADFPFAEVQAVLLDDRGGRAAADRVVLSARHGSLAGGVVNGVVRAEYDGTRAAAEGGDVLTATWRPAPGSGDPWRLDLAAGATRFGIEVRVRAHDRDGLPIPGVSVRVGPRGAATENVTTGATGWGAALLPGATEVMVVEARVGALVREVAVFPGVEVPLPEADRPDLVTLRELPIRAGQVRQMFIDVAPRPLVTGAGDTAVVEVRMLDAGGNPVRGEQVVIRADSGTVAQTQPRPDGSLQAIYTPPPGSSSRTVHITAESSGGSVATDLQLVPRPVRGGVSAAAGWVSNFGAVSSPTVDLVFQNKIPLLPDLLQARVGIGTYALASSVSDQVTGDEVQVRAQFFPVELGVAATQRQGRRVLDAGVSVVLLPFALSADFDGARGVGGSGIGPPGFLLHAGGGVRVAGSELFGEVRYLLAAARGGTISFEGSVGGGSLVAGYRVLY